MKQTRTRTKLFAFGAALILAATGAVANADDINHSIDANDSTISIEVGETGGTTYWVKPTGTGQTPEDGVNGCNLTGRTTLVVDATSSDPAIATVSPSQITFGSCGDVKTVSVTGVAEGTVTISLSEVSNSTAGTFNLAPATFTVVVSEPYVEEPADTTPPVLTYVGQSPTANGNGWNNSAVTLTWTCDDGDGSGVDHDNSTLSVELEAEGANRSGEAVCVDLAGNEARDTQSGINIDLTDPKIVFEGTDPAPNAAGWNNTAVTSTWTCTDAVSGVDSANSNLSHTIRDEGGEQMTEGICVDLAGNTVVDTQVVNIDLTPPTLTWTGGPADGSSFYFGSVPAAPTCGATDGLSGADGCEVTGYSTEVGEHTLTATAYDVAGNKTVEERTYTVLAWTIVGFKSPVDMDDWNAVKGGSTVPLKFEVFAGDTELTDTSVVESFKVVGQKCDAESSAAQDIALATTGKTELRYDVVDGQFIQNWKTPKMSNVCYSVTMTTLDGSSITADFRLK